MIWIVAYKQLLHQAQKVLGEDTLYIDFETSLETSLSASRIVFPPADNITLILSNDVQSRLLLLRAAKEFSGNINVVNLKGEFTNYSPLAVSDAELRECCKTPHYLSERERCALIEEHDNLPESRYYQLQDGHIASLSKEEITKFILQQITEPLKVSVAVGLCMGYSPKGWPRTDTFYLQQIERLAEKGKLVIKEEAGDIYQKIVEPIR